MFGGLVAGVIVLRKISNADCTSVSVPFGMRIGGPDWEFDKEDGWGFSVERECAMLKSSWALGIVDAVLFFISAVLALFIYRKNEQRAIREKNYIVDGGRTRRGRYW